MTGAAVEPAGGWEIEARSGIAVRAPGQHAYKMPFGKSEGWVGRDLSKYLPGIYWITVIARDLALKFGLQSDNLPEGTSMLDFGPDYLAFRLFDRANQWRTHPEEIDTFCSWIPGIFSL